jgi:hypothetical protein
MTCISRPPISLQGAGSDEALVRVPGLSSSSSSSSSSSWVSSFTAFALNTSLLLLHFPPPPPHPPRVLFPPPSPPARLTPRATHPHFCLWFPNPMVAIPTALDMLMHACSPAHKPNSTPSHASTHPCTHAHLPVTPFAREVHDVHLPVTPFACALLHARAHTHAR